MIRGTSLALALALTGAMLLSGVAQAASPLTQKCVRSKSQALRTCVAKCRSDFKEARAACYGPGAQCALDCSNASEACQAPVTKELEDLNDACNDAQADAIDVCRSAFQNNLIDDVQLEPVRKRRFPIVGNGDGVWSFVHLDDAAAATVLALERGEPGVYNVVDDDPAPVREWLPVLAEAIGAKPPRHVPTWLARALAGEAGVALMTEVRGASSEKAKRELGWTLRYPSWRQGFPEAYRSLRAAA